MQQPRVPLCLSGVQAFEYRAYDWPDSDSEEPCPSVSEFGAAAGGAEVSVEAEAPHRLPPWPRLPAAGERPGPSRPPAWAQATAAGRQAGLWAQWPPLEEQLAAQEVLPWQPPHVTTSLHDILAQRGQLIHALRGELAGAAERQAEREAAAEVALRRVRKDCDDLKAEVALLRNSILARGRGHEVAASEEAQLALLGERLLEHGQRQGSAAASGEPEASASAVPVAATPSRGGERESWWRELLPGASWSSLSFTIAPGEGAGTQRSASPSPRAPAAPQPGRFKKLRGRNPSRDKTFAQQLRSCTRLGSILFEVTDGWHFDEAPRTCQRLQHPLQTTGGSGPAREGAGSFSAGTRTSEPRAPRYDY